MDSPPVVQLRHISENGETGLKTTLSWTENSLKCVDTSWETVDDFGNRKYGYEKDRRHPSGYYSLEETKTLTSQIGGVVLCRKETTKWEWTERGGVTKEHSVEHVAPGQSERLAYKSFSTGPNAQPELGHPSAWHECWGEKHGGVGGSTKFRNKWTESSGGHKSGEKWVQHVDPNGHGVEQGETWWESMYGERWNKTWGVGHDGSSRRSYSQYQHSQVQHHNYDCGHCFEISSPSSSG